MRFDLSLDLSKCFQSLLRTLEVENRDAVADEEYFGRDYGQGESQEVEPSIRIVRVRGLNPFYSDDLHKSLVIYLPVISNDRQLQEEGDQNLDYADDLDYSQEHNLSRVPLANDSSPEKHLDDEDEEHKELEC